METFTVYGESPSGNDFEMPVDAKDEESAVDKAMEQLPDDYNVDSAD